MCPRSADLPAAFAGSRPLQSPLHGARSRPIVTPRVYVPDRCDHCYPDGVWSAAVGGLDELNPDAVVETGTSEDTTSQV